MPTATETSEGFISHFWSADQQMQWLSVEREVHAELAPGVVLVGILDAIGPNWFGDWKSHKPVKDKAALKQEFRFNVQTLTYGLLGLLLSFGGNRFTMRWAFKTDPPTFDHEWYSYSEEELYAWLWRVRDLAFEVKKRWGNPGRTNPTACLRYGPKYPCPFLHGCSSGQFDFVPLNAIPRVPHLQTERDWLQGGAVSPYPSDMLILDATSIECYLACPEKFRRIYVDNITEPPNEALQFGSEFHQRLARHYRSTLLPLEEKNG